MNIYYSLSISVHSFWYNVRDIKTDTPCVNTDKSPEGVDNIRNGLAM